MTITVTAVIEVPDNLRDLFDEQEFREEVMDALTVAVDDATGEEPEDIIVTIEVEDDE